MDLSGIIFVALAVAWAAYLVPKALKHHDEVVRNRSVDRFSHTMRVLARREPVNPRDSRLVVTPQRAATGPVVTGKRPGLTPGQLRARRAAARQAARRRRRVLGTLVLAGVVVGTLTAFSVLHVGWNAVPAGLVVAWLVLCRLMVRGEARADRGLLDQPGTSAADDQRTASDAVPAAYPVTRNEQGFDEVAPEADTSTSLPSTPGESGQAGGWDPMPVTLPTYVSKSTAERSVRTIDLESTGVWTSGRTEEDAAIARQADADRAAAKDADAHQGSGERRAVGG